MDERVLKRLLIIVGVSIIVILVFKSMMLKTATNLSNVAAEKKQSAVTTPVQQDAIPAYDAANAMELPAASAPGEIPTMELPAASGVGDGH